MLGEMTHSSRISTFEISSSTNKISLMSNIFMFAVQRPVQTIRRCICTDDARGLLEKEHCCGKDKHYELLKTINGKKREYIVVASYYFFSFHDAYYPLLKFFALLRLHKTCGSLLQIVKQKGFIPSNHCSFIVLLNSPL